MLAVLGGGEVTTIKWLVFQGAGGRINNDCTLSSATRDKAKGKFIKCVTHFHHRLLASLLRRFLAHFLRNGGVSFLFFSFSIFLCLRSMFCQVFFVACHLTIFAFASLALLIAADICHLDILSLRSSSFLFWPSNPGLQPLLRTHSYACHLRYWEEGDGLEKCTFECWCSGYNFGFRQGCHVTCKNVAYRADFQIFGHSFVVKIKWIKFWTKS